MLVNLLQTTALSTLTDLLADEASLGGGGSGPSADISGLILTFANPSGFTLLQRLGILDQAGTDHFAGLTARSDLVTSLDDLSEGEYGTDSVTDDNESILKSAWPSSRLESLPSTDFHRPANSGDTLTVYVKFAANIVSVGEIRFIIRNVWAQGLCTLSVTDQDLNPITPNVSPNVRTDRIFAENNLVAAGSPSTQSCGFAYYYPGYIRPSINDWIGKTAIVHVNPASGSLDNLGTAGSAGNFSGLSITGSGAGAYVEYDGVNLLEMSDISGIDDLNNAGRTDFTSRFLSYVGRFSVASFPTGSNVICGSATTSTAGSAPDAGAGLVTWGTDEVGYGMPGDAYHSFHNASNSAFILDTPFNFGTTQQLAAPADITRNNLYSGFLSRVTSTSEDFNNTYTSTDQIYTAQPAGASAQVTSNSNPGFWIFGIENNGGTITNAQASGSRMYELIIFPEGLTDGEHMLMSKYLDLGAETNTWGD